MSYFHNTGKMLNFPCLGLVPMNTKIILGLSLAAIFAVSMIATQSVLATGGSYLDITEGKVEVKTKNGEQTLKVKIKTGDKIVEEGAYGYGIITGAIPLIEDGVHVLDEDNNPIMLPENVLALTTHVCASDSFNQGDIDEVSNCPFDPPHYSAGVLEFLRDEVGWDLPEGEINQANDGPEFHAHVLDLTTIAEDSACAGAGHDLEVDVVRSLETENNISPNWDVKVKGKSIEIKKVPTSELFDAGVENIVSFTITPHLAEDGETITNLCLDITGAI